MSTEPMTPDQEYDYYARAENQQPQGSARRRARLSEPVPVRFPPELLEQIRQAAANDDRSVSSWLRRAAEHELRRSA
ncbi:YlcI/YnfO family protein [Rhodococcus erythropolis]